MFPEVKKEEVVALPEMVVEASAKSGLSDKDGYSTKGELIEPPVFPNPLDRIDLQWQPTIIRPQVMTNVDP
jgi:hypothetical protein